MTSSGRPLERDLVDADDGEPVEVLDVGLEGQELEEVGDEADVDGILVDDPEGLDDLGIVVKVQGHIDLGNPVFLDDGPEVVEPAQDLDPSVDADLRPLRDVVVKETQDPEPEVPEARELLGDGPAHLARADDEDVGQVQPPGDSGAS